MQHALAQLAEREAEVLQRFDRLEDAQVRELANRLSMLLFAPIGAAIAEGDGHPTHPWDDLEAEFAEQDALHNKGHEHAE
jgi:hypothetical protein